MTKAMATGRSLIAGALVASALILTAATARAQDPAPVQRPDAIQQPVTDGCQRNPAALLAFTSPEWVFVYSDPSKPPPPARLAEGTAISPHVAQGDLPQGHNWYDTNIDVEVDSPYAYLMGGDPATNTGNFGEGGKLHVEWEINTVPFSLFATDGDRLKLWGSWIWDCGHWGQGTGDPDFFLPGHDEPPILGGLIPIGGNIRGEGSEFHPMQAMVTRRANPYRPAVAESETDAFASNEGTPAYAQETCALQNKPPLVPSPILPGFFQSISYPPGYTSCVQDLNGSASRQPVNDRDYPFFVSMPDGRPSGADLRYRIEDAGVRGRGPAERVDVRSNGIQVNVPFNGFGNYKAETLGFGKRFYVGWEGANQIKATPLEVELDSVKVNNSLDKPGDTSTGIPPGEYNLYLDVNGRWMYLNDFASGLGSVSDGQSFQLNRKVDINVPRGAGVRVFAVGRECDLPKINPCPSTSEVAEDNDDPGRKADTYPSAEAAFGSHTLRPSSGNYELNYTIRRGKDQCFDTFTPQSRFLRKGRRATKRRLRLKGRTDDDQCEGRRGEVERVEVAVARKRGKKRKKCRFLKANGRLDKPRSCSEQSYLKARGKVRWKLRKKVRLRRGKYVAWARAIDSVGNVEHRVRKKRNKINFRVPLKRKHSRKHR